jgi:hypothetical protein
MKVKIAAPSARIPVIRSADGMATKVLRPKIKKNKTVHQPAIVLGMLISDSPLAKESIGRIANLNETTPVLIQGCELVALPGAHLPAMLKSQPIMKCPQFPSQFTLCSVPFCAIMDISYPNKNDRGNDV